MLISFFFFFSVFKILLRCWGETTNIYIPHFITVGFYPQDRVFSGFDLTSHLFGTPLLRSWLPGVVWSPAQQSPWVGSQVGAVMAFACGGRTYLQRGHQLEHTHAASCCPHVNVIRNEVLRLSVRLLWELTPAGAAWDIQLPHVWLLIPYSPSSRFLFFRLPFWYFLLLPPLLTPLWGARLLPLLMPWLFALRLVDIVISAKRRGFARPRGPECGVFKALAIVTVQVHDLAAGWGPTVMSLAFLPFGHICEIRWPLETSSRLPSILRSFWW